MNFLIKGHFQQEIDSQSSVYCPIKKDKNQKRNKLREKWSREQNIKYCQLLYKYQDVLISPILRKKQRIFAVLSRQIQTRTTPQVKSHHQKMIKKHLDVQGTIKFMEWRYSCQVIQQNRPEENLSSKDTQETLKRQSSIKNQGDSSQVKGNNEEYFQFKLENSYSEQGIDHYFDLGFLDM